MNKKLSVFLPFWCRLIVGLLMVQTAIWPFRLGYPQVFADSSSSGDNGPYNVRAQAFPLVVAAGETFEIRLEILPLAGAPAIESVGLESISSPEDIGLELKDVQSRVSGGIGHMTVRFLIPQSTITYSWTSIGLEISMVIHTVSGDFNATTFASVVVVRYMGYFARSDNSMYSGFQEIRDRPAGTWWLWCAYRNCPYSSNNQDLEYLSIEENRNYLEIGTMVPNGTELNVPKGAVLWLYGLNPFLMLAYTADVPSDMAGTFYVSHLQSLRSDYQIPEARVELHLEGNGFVFRPYDANKPDMVGDSIDPASLSPGIPVWRPLFNISWINGLRFTRNPGDTWNLGVIAVGAPGTSATLVARFVSTSDGRELFRRELRLRVGASELEGRTFHAEIEESLWPFDLGSAYDVFYYNEYLPTEKQIDLEFSHFDDRGLAWFDVRYSWGPASYTRTRPKVKVTLSYGAGYYTIWQAAVQRQENGQGWFACYSIFSIPCPEPEPDGTVHRFIDDPDPYYTSGPTGNEIVIRVYDQNGETVDEVSFEEIRTVETIPWTGTVLVESSFQYKIALRDQGRNIVGYLIDGLQGNYRKRLDIWRDNYHEWLETNGRAEDFESAADLLLEWNDAFDGGTIAADLYLQGHQTPYWSPHESYEETVFLGWYGAPFTTAGRPAEEETRLDLVATPPMLSLRDIMQNQTVDFTVMLQRNGRPIAGVPVTVVGPQAGVLALPNPAVTDEHGRMTFSWIPPEPDYFRGASFPVPFIFTVQAEDMTRQVEVDVAESTWTIRGRVVSRHAGAVLSDTDGDGLVPVAGAEVGISPDFSSGAVATTNADGWFELPVNRPDTYTLYVRKNSSDPPYTATRKTDVRVEEDNETTTLTEPLYLANLGVARQKERTYLPYLRDYLAPTELERLLHVEPPADPEAEAEAFLAWLRHVEETESWYEEALRRLNLAESIAYEGARAAEEFSDFAAQEIWDGTVGAFARLLQKNLENLRVVELAKSALKNRIQLLEQSQGNAAQLRELRKTLQMIETAETRMLEINRKLNQLQYTLYAKLIVPIAQSDSTTQRTDKVLFLKLYKYLIDRLNDYLINQAQSIVLQSKAGQMASEAAAQALVPIQQSVDRLIETIQEQFAKFLALGFRRQVGEALMNASSWAQNGDFPQYETSYAKARNLTRAALDRQQEIVDRMRSEVRHYESVKTFVDGVIADWDGWAKAALVAVTGGTAAQAVATVDKILQFLQTIEPVAQVAAGLKWTGPLADEGELTRATVYGVRTAFSKTGRIRVGVHSPVHLMAVDEFGRRTGVDAAGNSYAEIPGAYFLPASETTPETLVLPEGVARYRIVVSGIGQGTYALEVGTENAEGQFETARSYSGTASPGSVAVVDVETTADGVAASDMLGSPDEPDRLAIVDPAGSEQETLRLVSGEERELHAILRDDEDLPVAFGAAVQWTVVEGGSSLEVAADGDGRKARLVAHRAGRALLRAQAGDLSSTLSVEVVPALPVDIRVEVSQQTTRGGEPVTLTAEVTDGHNPLEGWNVSFLTPDFGLEPLAQAVSDASGRATAVWTVPETAAGPTTVVASVYVPNVGYVSGSAGLAILPSSDSGASPPESSLPIVTDAGTPIGRATIPTGAFASALRPVVNARTLVADADRPTAEEQEILSKAIPTIPSSLRPVGPIVELSAIDLATGRAIQPEAPIVLRVNSPIALSEQIGVYTAVYGDGGWTWQRLAEQGRGSDWIEVFATHFSPFALLEETGTGSSGGSSGGASGPGAGMGSGSGSGSGSAGSAVVPGAGAPNGDATAQLERFADGEAVIRDNADGRMIDIAVSADAVARKLDEQSPVVSLDFSSLTLRGKDTVKLVIDAERTQAIRQAGRIVLVAFDGLTLRIPSANLHAFVDSDGRTVLRIAVGDPPSFASVGDAKQTAFAVSRSYAVYGPDPNAANTVLSSGIDMTIRLSSGDYDARKAALYWKTVGGQWTYRGGRPGPDGLITVPLHRFGPWAAFVYARTFADIANHWSKDAVEVLAAHHIIRGRTDDRFEPDSPVTRAEFAALILNALGLQPETSVAPFRDVAPDAWYRDIVATAWRRGLMTGDGEAFRPDVPITREEMAVVVARAIGWNGQPSSTAPTFTDRADISAWATDAVGFLQDQGLVSGTGEGLFMPKAAASRAQAAVLLCRILFKD